MVTGPDGVRDEGPTNPGAAPVLPLPPEVEAKRKTAAEARRGSDSAHQCSRAASRRIGVAAMTTSMTALTDWSSPVPGQPNAAAYWLP